MILVQLCWYNMYYKILNPSMCHRMFQYKIGLNTSTKGGGFYICKKKDIGYWLRLHHNPIICEAVLCEDSVIHKGRRKIRTDKIILQNPLPIREFLGKQDEDTLIDYVYDDGMNLEYIDQQTPDICKLALKQNGRSLQFVKNPNKSHYLEAITQTGRALQYVHEQTQSLCLHAVKQNGMSLKYVNKQDKTICMMAVHNNGNALKYVKEPTPYIYKVAVEQNGYALQYIEHQTDELVNLAILQNPLAKIWKKSVKAQPVQAKTKAESMDWFYED